MKCVVGILLTMFFLLGLTSCQKEKKANRVPILEVGGKYLYKDEIDYIIPKNVTLVDSANVADRYIRKWVTDVLMYEYAKRNLSNIDDINELVEEYRKSLIIHEYEQALVALRVDTIVAEADAKIFYEQYGASMILENNLIKGLLLIVPKDAPKIETVREWVRTADEISIEKIEKYSLQNAVSYDYFLDKWTPFYEILKKAPFQVDDSKNYITSQRFDETVDSTMHYFLKIKSAIPIGYKEPYEIAKNRIKNTLLNKRKSDFIIDFEKSVYKDAIDKGDVIFFE